MPQNAFAPNPAEGAYTLAGGEAGAEGSLPSPNPIPAVGLRHHISALRACSFGRGGDSCSLIGGGGVDAPGAGDLRYWFNKAAVCPNLTTVIRTVQPTYNNLHATSTESEPAVYLTSTGRTYPLAAIGWQRIIGSIMVSGFNEHSDNSDNSTDVLLTRIYTRIYLSRQYDNGGRIG